MKIAVEIGWGHKPGGARRVALNMLAAMVGQRPEHHYTVLSNCAHAALDGLCVDQQVLAKPRWVSQLIWDQLLFPHVAVPRAHRRLRPNVIHYTNNISPFVGGNPCVVTLHDMAPYVVAKSFHPLHAAYQRLCARNTVRKAERVITVSNSAKQEICDILGVADDRVVVAPLETRGCLATYDPGSGRYTVHTPSQGVNELRDGLAAALEVPTWSVRVVTAAVGGASSRPGIFASCSRPTPMLAGRPRRAARGAPRPAYRLPRPGRDHGPVLVNGAAARY